ncbi:hypothetical protein MTAT_16680 [Moorella thermoacetica]|uniref:Type II secretion system protein GspF domain-containing protein n=1 Tax=Neomoorella thermoacetica TaxID=1525 RepID=A0A1D7X8B2_NEOTH|nr:hypothetical protein Maut_00675 [Moorella thermoacetica]OIQ59744.1 hypothetical protein MOTE_10000 [Moorella thermoacetica]TYL12845.1 hypothetical protein MTAT_16680 [Moorella thermoacetica]
MVIAAVLCAVAVLVWLVPLPRSIAVGKGDVRAALVADMAEVARAEGLEVDLSPLVRIRAAILACGVLWAAASLVGKGPAAAVTPLALTILGWRASKGYLKMAEKKREEDIAREFPLLISLVRVYAKASDLFMALDTARKVLRGELRRQLDVMDRELKVYPLNVALRRMAARCRYGPMDSFVSVLLFGITTGADVDAILAGFARKAYEARANEAKRKVKAQPVFMSILPVILGLLLLIVFVFPLFADIIQKLKF